MPLRAPAEALRNLPLPHPETARATGCRRERVRALCVLSGGAEHTVETPRAPRLPSASSTVEASLVPVSRSLRRLQRAVRSGQGIALLTAARAPPARSLADPSTSPRPHTPGGQRRRVCRASRPLTVAKSRFAAQTLTLTLTPTQALTLALTLSACRSRCRQAVADGGHAGRAAGQPRASGSCLSSTRCASRGCAARVSVSARVRTLTHTLTLALASSTRPRCSAVCRARCALSVMRHLAGGDVQVPKANDAVAHSVRSGRQAWVISRFPAQMYGEETAAAPEE